MITRKSSVLAAVLNIAMRMLRDPQRPGCPDNQQPSSLCTRVQSELPRVEYIEATRLQAHNALNMHGKKAKCRYNSRFMSGGRFSEHRTVSGSTLSQTCHGMYGCCLCYPDSISMRAYRDLTSAKPLTASRSIGARRAGRRNVSMTLVLGSAGCSPGRAPAEYAWIKENVNKAWAQKKWNLAHHCTVSSVPKYPT